MMRGYEVDEMVAAHCKEVSMDNSGLREVVACLLDKAYGILPDNTDWADDILALVDEDRAAEAQRYVDASLLAAKHNENWQKRAEKAEAELDELKRSGYYALRQDMERMKAERDDLRAMLDRIAAIPDVADCFHAPSEENIADGVEGAIDDLRRKLEEAQEYMQHQPGCNAPFGKEYGCKCGLDALLAKIGGGK